MGNSDCNISCLNTPRSKILVTGNTSSCLAFPIKTRSKSGANFAPLTLRTAKNLQESKLNVFMFSYSKTRTTSQICPCEKNLSSSSPENNSWICC